MTSKEADSPTASTTTTSLFAGTNIGPPSLPTAAMSGLIDDASCHMEDLENANDSQLYTILQELRNTAFFRTFVVDLDHKCPLRSWRPNACPDANRVACQGACLR